MKLSLKLAAMFLLPVTLVMAAFGVVRVRREAALFEDDTKRDHRHVGKTLALATAEV